MNIKITQDNEFNSKQNRTILQFSSLRSFLTIENETNEKESAKI